MKKRVVAWVLVFMIIGMPIGFSSSELFSNVKVPRVDVSDTLESSEDGLTRYVYGEGLVASVKSGNVKYHHSDRLQSNRLVTDSSGSVEKEFKSLPFGQEISNSGVKYAFATNKELDESELYYFGARYYDSDLGRFSGVDVIRSEPAYQYVKNNPMNLVDPNGMYPEEEEEDTISCIEGCHNTRRQRSHYNFKEYDSSHHNLPDFPSSLEELESEQEHIDLDCRGFSFPFPDFPEMYIITEYGPIQGTEIVGTTIKFTIPFGKTKSHQDLLNEAIDYARKEWYKDGNTKVFSLDKSDKTQKPVWETSDYFTLRELLNMGMNRLPPNVYPIWVLPSRDGTSFEKSSENLLPGQRFVSEFMLNNVDSFKMRGMDAFITLNDLTY